MLLILWPDSVSSRNKLLSTEHLIDLSTFSQSSQCTGFLATDIQELLNKTGWEVGSVRPCPATYYKMSVGQKVLFRFLPSNWSRFVCFVRVWGGLDGVEPQGTIIAWLELTQTVRPSHFSRNLPSQLCLLSSWRIFQSHHQLSSDQHQQSCLLSSQNWEPACLPAREVFNVISSFRLIMRE